MHEEILSYNGSIIFGFNSQDDVKVDGKIVDEEAKEHGSQLSYHREDGDAE